MNKGGTDVQELSHHRLAEYLKLTFVAAKPPPSHVSTEVAAAHLLIFAARVTN